MNHSAATSSRNGLLPPSLPEPSLIIEPNWKERFVHLEPDWHEVKKTVKVVGAVFVTLAALSLVATAYTLVALKAKVIVIVGLTVGLSLVTFLSAIIGLALLSEDSFWKDPAFCIERAKAAWKDIEQNQLSYSQIQLTYGNEIREYGILNNQDINQLFRRDANNYPLFCQKHGVEALKILDETNRALLKDSFIKFIQSSETSESTLSLFEENTREYTFSQFINHYDQELKELKISYTEIDCLKQKLIQELISLSSSIDVTLDDYEEALNIFGLDKKELRIHLIEQKALQVVSGSLSYFNFKSQIKPAYQDAIPEEVISLLRETLISYLKQGHIGFLEAKQLFGKELQFLDISDDAFRGMVLSKELELLSRKQRNYSQYKARNGLESLTFLSRKQKLALRRSLIDLCCHDKEGLISFQKKFQKDCVALKVSKDNLYGVILPIEYEKLRSQSLSYLDFIQRNGLKAVVVLLQKVPESKEELVKSFLVQPYSNMVKAEYEKSCELLEISKDTIQQVLGQDLSYKSFKAKHSLSPIEDNILTEEQKAQLAADLQKIIVQDPYAQMKLYLNDYQVLRLDLKELLKRRWQDYSIQRLLKEEKEAFIQSMALKVFAPEEWFDKAIAETDHESVKERLNKYPELFATGVFHGQQPLLAALFEEEISSISQLEELLTTYSEDIFKYQFLTSSSPLLKAFIVDYYMRNPKNVYENLVSNTIHSMLDRSKLIDTQTGVVLNNNRREYETLRISYLDAKVSIQTQAKEKIEQAQAEKLKHLEEVKKTHEIARLCNDFKEKGHRRSECKKERGLCQQKLEANRRMQRQINYKIKVLEQQNRSLQEQLHSLSERDPLEAVNQLNNQINEIEISLAHLNEKQIKTPAKALYINSRKDEFRHHLIRLRKKIEEINQSPTQTIDKMRETLDQSVLQLNTFKNELEEVKKQGRDIQIELNQQQENLENLDRKAIQAHNVLNHAQNEVKKVEEELDKQYRSKFFAITQEKEKALGDLLAEFNLALEGINQKIIADLEALH